MKQNFLLAIATNKHRYWFVVAIFSVLLITTLYFGFNIQQGITLRESQSAVTSATLSLSKDSLSHIVDIPYHLMQKASIHFLGLSAFSIKLPSIILGAILGFTLVLLLKKWLLRSNIAFFTGIIAITNVQFVLLATSGTPLIMTVLWTMLIFLAGLALARQPKSLLWALLLSVMISLSLYTPLSVYVLVALIIISLLHPHLRYVIRTIPLQYKFICATLSLLIISPLVAGLIYEPSQVWKILGIPINHIDIATLKYNITLIGKTYLTFWYSNISSVGISPAFNIASLCLIIFGGLRLINHLHAARSYGLAFLFPILLLPVILQPEYVVILLVPMILLLAIGVEALLEEWYKLFPHNPYARVVALAPVSVLLTGIVIANINIYSGVQRFNENTARYYSYDLSILKPHLSTYPNAIIVATKLYSPFYDLLRKEYPAITVTNSIPQRTKSVPIIITEGTGVLAEKLGKPSLILTDSFKERSPRFYIYSKAE